MNTEHATPELFEALSAAQGEIENANKNSNNPRYGSKYADLAEVLNTIRDALPKHGLSLIQSPSFDGSMASVTTIIAHKSGGFITTTASCVPAKSDAQGIGAATTYLRRYSAAAIAGIAQEDDDGNTAAHNYKPVPAAHDRKPVSAEALPLLTEKKFEEYTPKWIERIKNGRGTPDELIIMINSRYRLTPAQVERIHALKKQEANASAIGMEPAEQGYPA